MAEADDRRLVEMVDAGLTLAEIGSKLGIAPTTVGNRIRKLGLDGTRRVRRSAAIREARAAGRNSLVLACPEHGDTPFWIGRKATRCKKCNSRAVAKRRREVKRILIAEAGGCCTLCGYDRSLVALEFHHLDPGVKEFALSGAGITRSLASSRAEAAKCVVLCANCHAEVEAGLTAVPVR